SDNPLSSTQAANWVHVDRGKTFAMDYLIPRPSCMYYSMPITNSCFDSHTIRRFLSARRFDADDALKQFQETSLFRQEKQILRLYDVIDISDYEQARQFYPHWSGRRDREGLPICMFDLAHLDKDTLARWEKTRKNTGWAYPRCESSNTSDMLQLASVFHETLIRFILPLCSIMMDRPNCSVSITSSTYIVDASNLGIKQGWSVCNAPSYFAVIWNSLKGWVDPNMAGKIVVLMNTEVLPTLREYIDNANIPTVFGGGYCFEHGMLPDLDANIRQRLNWNISKRSLTPGPLKWIEDSDGKITTLTVGSKDSSKRSIRIATLDCVKK
ncbi:hypothetical protein N7491_004446, partial [Penicillium cf. griseofulvum]